MSPACPRENCPVTPLMRFKLDAKMMFRQITVILSLQNEDKIRSDMRN
jgi:hypothetical protein